MQPGAGVGPVAVDRARAFAQDFGDLGNRQAREVLELDDFSGCVVLAAQGFKRIIQGDEVVDGGGDRIGHGIVVEPLLVTAVLDAMLAPVVVDEDALIASAAAAKKCPRLSQRRVWSPSTSRT